MSDIFQTEDAPLMGSVLAYLTIPDTGWYRRQLAKALSLLCEPANWIEQGGGDIDEATSASVAAFETLEFGGAIVPLGSIELYAGVSAPEGWLLCDGSAVSRTDYADLFGLIGSTYGHGDTSTTFNLPDLRGRVPIGSGQGVELNGGALGNHFGEASHLLTVNELPAHHHQQQVANTSAFSAPSSSGSGRLGAQGFATNSTTALNTLDSGGGQAHDNVQPSLALNFIISTR